MRFSQEPEVTQTTHTFCGSCEPQSLESLYNWRFKTHETDQPKELATTPRPGFPIPLPTDPGCKCRCHHGPAEHWCLVQNTQPALAPAPVPNWSPALGSRADGCHPAGMAQSRVFLVCRARPLRLQRQDCFLHTPIGKAEILRTSLPAAFQGKQLSRITPRYFLCQSPSRYLNRKTRVTPLEGLRGFSFLYKGTLVV